MKRRVTPALASRKSNKTTFLRMADLQALLVFLFIQEDEKWG
jgi:hypothetical protein